MYFYHQNYKLLKILGKFYELFPYRDRSKFFIKDDIVQLLFEFF